MNKYRKKPVVVEAERFWVNDDHDHMDALIDWINGCGRSATHDGRDIYIQTDEGEMLARVGDWIIRGVEGEFYPCKNSIFEATYEPVPYPES